MAKVFLILGSNLGDRLGYLNNACTDIEQGIGAVLKKSAVYETEPWGFYHENQFLNQVLKIETQVEPLALLNALKKIEAAYGRTRVEGGYTARTLDIDILTYEDMVFDTPELTIPHPQMTKRRFVLEPFAEIAQHVIHPLLKKEIGELLLVCEDHNRVNKIN